MSYKSGKFWAHNLEISWGALFAKKTHNCRKGMPVGEADKHLLGLPVAVLTSLLIQNARHKPSEDNSTFITLIQIPPRLQIDHEF